VQVAELGERNSVLLSVIKKGGGIGVKKTGGPVLAASVFAIFRL